MFAQNSKSSYEQAAVHTVDVTAGWSDIAMTVNKHSRTGLVSLKKWSTLPMVALSISLPDPPCSLHLANGEPKVKQTFNHSPMPL